MSTDSVIRLIQPVTFDDRLTAVLRDGAQALLAKAVEAEVAVFLAKHAALKSEDGHQRVVRHGHLPEREVMTGIGPVAVRQPRVARSPEIWMAETKAAAQAAFDAFVESYKVKYEKAADCLEKDRDVLLEFYDFPAEHWKHLRTTNPIESTFATVRHRTIRSKGCLSNRTALAKVFKLVETAQKHWRRSTVMPCCQS